MKNAMPMLLPAMNMSNGCLDIKSAACVAHLHTSSSENNYGFLHNTTSLILSCRYAITIFGVSNSTFEYGLLPIA